MIFYQIDRFVGIAIFPIGYTMFFINQNNTNRLALDSVQYGERQS